MRHKPLGLYIQPLEVLLNALYVYRKTLVYQPEFKREVKESRDLWNYLRNKVHEAPRRKPGVTNLGYRPLSSLWRHEVKLIIRALRFYENKDHDLEDRRDIKAMLRLFQDHVKVAPTKVLYKPQHGD